MRCLVKRTTLFCFGTISNKQPSLRSVQSVNNVIFHLRYVMHGEHYCVTFTIMKIVSWDESRERLKQKISILTDDNVLFPKEKQEELLRRLEAKLGQTREAITQILSKL